MALDAQPSKPNNRPDLLILWGGILFALVFTGLIWWAGARLDAVELLPDQGKLVINEGDSVQATPWLFQQIPDLFEIKDSKYQFELVGYKPRKFTGLQIAKNPGINVVWTGCTMIVVGITLSSFIFHRRIWAKIVPGPTGVTVHIGGTTHNSQIDFNK